MPIAVPIAEPNARTTDCEPLMSAPQQLYTYHDAGDVPGNMYGLPVGYGMYSNVNDSKNDLVAYH